MCHLVASGYKPIKLGVHLTELLFATRWLKVQHVKFGIDAMVAKRGKLEAWQANMYVCVILMPSLPLH